VKGVEALVARSQFSTTHDRHAHLRLSSSLLPNVIFDFRVAGFRGKDRNTFSKQREEPVCDFFAECVHGAFDCPRSTGAALGPGLALIALALALVV
jgi:hypothetical protein